MIQQCRHSDFEKILDIINEAAQAYVNVIPDDCLHTPYMSEKKLAAEMAAGISFWGWFESEQLLGVMGVQRVMDATLIRHAYVRSNYQGKSIGGQLLKFLTKEAKGRILVGTWANAVWAISFYKRNGFELVSKTEKDRLLATYWNISARQTETSVVLQYTDKDK